MRRLLAILLVLACATAAWAKMWDSTFPILLKPSSIKLWESTIGASGATYPDITLWLNFEENDTTGDYNIGTNECSSGESNETHPRNSRSTPPGRHDAGGGAVNII